MQDLNEYFLAVTEKSKFPCALGDVGGFVNFRNSGQRGSVKEFTISLESVLSGLRDIKNNISIFQSLSHYVEKGWRDAGSQYFQDLVLNSMITVQTKPCFTTFSKIISWANEASVLDYDDNIIDLRVDSLNTTISKLEKLSATFSPNQLESISASAKINELVINSSLSFLSKPFLLLAGISGTGKTRFVREQAKATGQFNETYCLVSVRPDWHEPSDLLGYISRLANHGQAEYITTDVLQFIAKAWRGIADNGLSIEVQHIDEQGERLVVTGDRDALNEVLPYWLCLDEMNLAPVEQYFADYLSVLETREWRWDGDAFTYSSDALLKPAMINAVADTDKLRKDLGFEAAEYDELWQLICEHGLAIPFNLMVAGTVNMDETTHGFSRKVIDRALSFDFGEFFPNDYAEFFEPTIGNKALSYPVLSHANYSQDKLPSIDSDGQKSIDFLDAVNTVLDNTPFRLAYRALNELLLAVISEAPDDQDTLHLQAIWDDFLMCKVLPRIEGDSDKLMTDDSQQSLLQKLSQCLTTQLAEIWNEAEGAGTARPDLYREKAATEGDAKVLRIACRSKAKLEWMQKRLERSGFTSFWP